MVEFMDKKKKIACPTRFKKEDIAIEYAKREVFKKGYSKALIYRLVISIRCK